MQSFLQQEQQQMRTATTRKQFAYMGEKTRRIPRPDQSPTPPEWALPHLHSSFQQIFHFEKRQKTFQTAFFFKKKKNQNQKQGKRIKTHQRTRT
jgi:hypothetical protein